MNIIKVALLIFSGSNHSDIVYKCYKFCSCALSIFESTGQRICDFLCTDLNV